MENINLTTLLESVINGMVDLNTYPDLKKIVDMYKNVKIQGGDYIIRPDDFKSLLNGGDVNTKDFFYYYNRQEFFTPLTNDSPQYRVYNLNKGLLKKLNNKQDPDYQLYLKAYTQLHSLIDDLNVNKNNSQTNNNSTKTSNTSQDTQIPTAANDVLNLSSTSYLYANNIVENGDEQFTVDDDTLSVFRNHISNPNVGKYGYAILNNQINLPDDFSSKEGLVYTLYKKLRSECTELIRSITVMKSKMSNTFGGRNISNNDANNHYIFTTVPSLPFSNLRDNVSIVRFNYNLYELNGVPYGKGEKYKATFKYSSLTRRHRFIDVILRSNEFYFKNNEFPVIETYKKYNAYYKINGRDTPLLISLDIIELAHNNSKGETNSEQYLKTPSCGSMDELYRIVDSIISTKNV